MASIRYSVIALLVLAGLLVAIQPTSARASCAMDTVAAMPMMHHHSHAPAPPTLQNCPVCLGVLPSLPVIEPHALQPVALFTAQPHIIPGIDPALDPPPPRA